MSDFIDDLENDGIQDYEEVVDSKSDDGLNSDSDKSDDDIRRKKQPKQRESIDKMYDDVMELMEEFKEGTSLEYEKNDNKHMLPFIEQCRPSTLDEIISHNVIVTTLQKFIKNKYFPHFLLSGPPGTGKTSAIMAFARELYGDKYSLMVLDINASEERGIEIIRNKIKEFVCAKAIFIKQDSSVFKLVVLDEADAMTTDAQAMLVSFMERYSVNVRFCLICNYIKKISNAIQSRCTIFKFSPLSKLDMVKKVNEVVKQHDIDITKGGIETLIKVSKGDMRKVLNELQVTSMAHDKIDSDTITTCMGYPTSTDISNIYKTLINENFTECAQQFERILTTNGYSLTNILLELSEIITKKFINDKINYEKYATLLVNLRQIETHLTTCSNDQLQLMGIVSAFKLVYPTN
jgi:replication factor C subunit 3/5